MNQRMIKELLYLIIVVECVAMFGLLYYSGGKWDMSYAMDSCHSAANEEIKKLQQR